MQQPQLILAVVTMKGKTMTMPTMNDANYKCRAQGGNASCIQSLALPPMQKELELLII